MGSGLKNVQIAHNGAAEDEEKKRDTETPLASQSLLLLLVLTNHCTALQNPYRSALFSFVDMQGEYRLSDRSGSDSLRDSRRLMIASTTSTVCLSFFPPTENCDTSLTKGAFKFNLNKLYATVCKIPNTDQVTLLLYMLLHRNSSVKQDIMRRHDIQLLVNVLFSYSHSE